MDIWGLGAARSLIQLANDPLSIDRVVAKYLPYFTFSIGKVSIDAKMFAISKTAMNVCRDVAHDPSGGNLLFKNKIIYRPVFSDGNKIVIAPEIDSILKLPVILGLSCCMNQASQNQTWAQRIRPCKWCQRFFVCKTDRGSKFCSLDCRTTEKNNRKRAGAPVNEGIGTPFTRGN